MTTPKITLNNLIKFDIYSDRFLKTTAEDIDGAIMGTVVHKNGLYFYVYANRKAGNGLESASIYLVKFNGMFTNKLIAIDSTSIDYANSPVANTFGTDDVHPAHSAAIDRLYTRLLESNN